MEHNLKPAAICFNNEKSWCSGASDPSVSVSSFSSCLQISPFSSSLSFFLPDGLGLSSGMQRQTLLVLNLGLLWPAYFWVSCYIQMKGILNITANVSDPSSSILYNTEHHDPWMFYQASLIKRLKSTSNDHEGKLK